MNIRSAMTVAVVLLTAACVPQTLDSATTAVADASTSTTFTPVSSLPPVTPSSVALPLPPPESPNPDPRPPPPDTSAAAGSAGLAVIAAGGASLADGPDGSVLVQAHEGLVMPVEGREGDWFRLLSPCDTEVWVHANEIRFVPRSRNDATAIESAVIVLDPGHGGPNRGATGPTGLGEPGVNLDIARRARDLLGESHDIDWETGMVLPGSTYGPAAAVWLTRTEGPVGADYEAGLLFRARFAVAAGADALVSIHNNAEPDGSFDGPGSEAYYSVRSEESRRLAGLIVEEFRRGFAAFDVSWVGDTDAGAKYRLNAEGDDYYGLIRFSEVPVAIAEGAFISSSEEEALLRTVEFRQAYAEAVYRAVVRFVSTDDPGSGFTEPYPRTVPAGSGAPLPTCEIPAQP